MPRFLFSYRVPEACQPGAESSTAWEAWFKGLGTSRVDTGPGVVATRTPGKPDAGTRLGGYSLVTAEDMDGAAALARGCHSCSSAVAWRSAPFRSSSITCGPTFMPEALRERARARFGTSVRRHCRCLRPPCGVPVPPGRLSTHSHRAGYFSERKCAHCKTTRTRQLPVSGLRTPQRAGA